MAGVTSIAFDLLSFSAITVLIVIGLGVIASMMGIFNFAHGEFVLLGAYTVYLTDAARAIRCLARHVRRAARWWRSSGSRSSAA